MANPAGYLRFKSRSGDDVPIRLLNGHTTIIRPQWGEPLHPMFHADAYANGCMSEDMAGVAGPQAVEGSQGGPNPNDVLTPERRKEIIRENIVMICQRQNPGDFTGTGLPTTVAVSDACGFTVGAEERNVICEEIAADKG